MSGDTLAGRASSDLVLRRVHGARGHEDTENRRQTEAAGGFRRDRRICVEVLKNPATEEGILLKVMTRGPFEQGQQVWIIDRDGSKIGATVENVLTQTVDREVTLSTVLPA